MSRSHHPVAEHRGGRSRAQHVGIVDAVAARQHRVHQGHDLVPGVVIVEGHDNRVWQALTNEQSALVQWPWWRREPHRPCRKGISRVMGEPLPQLLTVDPG